MKHLKSINELFNTTRKANVDKFRWHFKSNDTLHASMHSEINGSEYYFIIGLDNGMLQISFSTDEEENFKEITNRGDILKIMATVPSVLEMFKSAASAEGKGDMQVTSMVIEPSKSKEKDEEGKDALDTSRGRIYHAAIQKWLRGYDYEFEEYKDALEYTFNEPVALSTFSFNTR